MCDLMTDDIRSAEPDEIPQKKKDKPLALMLLKVFGLFAAAGSPDTGVWAGLARFPGLSRTS